MFTGLISPKEVKRFHGLFTGPGNDNVCSHDYPIASSTIAKKSLSPSRRALPFHRPGLNWNSSRQSAN